MRHRDIKEGRWYVIDFQSDAPALAFVGKGLVITRTPRNYAQGTIAVLCEDGEVGYFGSNDFDRPTRAPKCKVVRKLLFDAARRILH